MPGSPIVVTYNSTDITGSCVFAECNFEAQMAAVPGTFQVVVRDMDQTLDFTTGKEITLDIDGQRIYGGYVTQVSKTYFFPSDETIDPGAVQSRQWVLVGVDYNILLDKLVLRNTADYTHDIPKITGSPTDGDVIRDWFDNYFDLPAGFNFSSATYIIDTHTFSTTGNYLWMTQGSTMRQVLENLALYGAVFWIDADKQFNYLPVQETVAPWGFSDVPNNDPIGVGTPTYGFRDGEYSEDASTVVNDAIVWGGSEWAVNGDVVYSRQQNAASIAAHGRWQVGEVRVGEANYKSQAEVTARAKVIVNGTDSGTDPVNGTQSLANPEKQFRCTWFSTGVPEVTGTPVHLLPSQIVPIRLYVFSDDGGITPFAVDLPMRQVSITFPDLDPNGDAYAQFDGSFAILMSDQVWLWKFLREGSSRAATTTIATSADNSSVDPVYGSAYQGEPSPATDGATTVFTIPFGYIGGTLQLYVNGLLQEASAFTESDPPTGEITLTFTPVTDDGLYVKATLSG
jgi:hypothetical protein